MDHVVHGSHGSWATLARCHIGHGSRGLDYESCWSRAM